MLIVRAATDSGFTQIPNATLRDKRLPWNVRGILCWLLSHQAGYEIDSDSIVDQGPSDMKGNGRDAVRRALTILEETGYIRRTRVRDEKGVWKGVAYTVYDRPQPTEPTAGPGTGNPAPASDPDANPQVSPQTDYPAPDEPAPGYPTPDNPATSTRTPALALREDQDPSLREGYAPAHTHTREEPQTGQVSTLDLFDIEPPASPSPKPGKIRTRKPTKPLAGSTAVADTLVRSWWETQDPKPTNFMAVRSAVVACLDAGWSSEKIPQALEDVAESPFPVRAGSLETALKRRNKPAPLPQRQGFTPYFDPPDNSGYVPLKDFLRNLEAKTS